MVAHSLFSMEYSQSCSRKGDSSGRSNESHDSDGILCRSTLHRRGNEDARGTFHGTFHGKRERERANDLELFTVSSTSGRATNVLLTIHVEKIRKAQQDEVVSIHVLWGILLHRCRRRESHPLPVYLTTSSDGFSYRWYVPGHRLVVPHVLIDLVLHACHDHAPCGGHLAYTQANV